MPKAFKSSRVQAFNVIGLFFVLALGLLNPLNIERASAQTPFYQGKTIRVIVGYQPGDNHDQYARTYGRFTPHINAGYEVTTGPSDQNNLRYVVGMDAALHPRFTLAGDVLGRWFNEQSGNGAHIVDFAVSAKWNVWRSLLLDAAVQVPINKDEGLRADFIWTVGVEYTF